MEKVYEIISKPISEFLESIGLNISVNTVLVIFIILGIVLPLLARKGLTYIIKVFNTRSNNIDLHPFFNPEEIKSTRKIYINQKFQNVDPDKEDELIYTHSSVAKNDLIEFFLNSFSKESDKRFFILLAGSGMGKTTFSLNLFFKYNSLLRYLTKRNRYKMVLIPLGYADSDLSIQQIIEKNEHINTILLLDAFDEDKRAITNGRIRIQDIIEKTKDFRFVIITCRTQFFNNEKLEPKETNVPRLGTKKGYYHFEKLYLSPFTNNDVSKFIFKKYGILKYFSKEKRKANQIVIKSPFLMVRPMLLEFIRDIAKNQSEYRYKYEIYEALINSWLDRESLNFSSNKRFSFKAELLKFSNEISREIYHNRERLGYTISLIVFEKIANKNNLDLSLFEMQTRSLLNRTPDGNYKFSHKSILEYFLATQIFLDLTFKKDFNEDGMNMTTEFYDELCFVNNFLPSLDSSIFKNHLKSDKELNIQNILSIDSIEISDLTIDNLRAFRAFRNITEISIINCVINSIDDINCYHRLTKLKIVSSRIKDLSKIEKLTNLKSMVLSNIGLYNYQINEISWKNFKNLLNLDLSMNNIDRFDQIVEMPHLRTICLNSNKILSIVIPETLLKLEVANNNLTHLKLTDSDLTYVDSSNNHLSSITIKNVVKLREINLANNRIHNLEIEENSSINSLNICNNLLNEPFKSLENLKELIEIDLSYNPITNLTYLNKHKKLKRLSINNISVSKINYHDIPDSLETITISKIEIENKIFKEFKLEENGTRLSRIEKSSFYKK